MSTAAPIKPAKRTRRKKQRRQASSSPSSASSSSGSESEDDGPAQPALIPVALQDMNAADSSDSDTSSSSDSSSSDDDGEDVKMKVPAAAVASSSKAARPQARYPTNSPSPPPRTLPSFLDARPNESREVQESERKERFRQVFMGKVVEAFGSELEEMREADPTLNQSRLHLLINSLASGIDVFDNTTTTGVVDMAVDEVGVVLGDK